MNQYPKPLSDSGREFVASKLVERAGESHPEIVELAAAYAQYQQAYSHINEYLFEMANAETPSLTTAHSIPSLPRG